MKMYRRTLSLVLLALLVSALIQIPAMAQEITVSTDKPVYAPGELVTISGVAAANAWVAVDVKDPLSESVLVPLSLLPRRWL